MAQPEDGTTVQESGGFGGPDNYRGLAVGHPFAKLAMCAINLRIQAIADEQQLRAPTQTGFRPGYTVEDLALVLQVCIQQANVTRTLLALLFVDLQKAYDSVDRHHLWTVLMDDLGIPEGLIAAI